MPPAPLFREEETLTLRGVGRGLACLCASVCAVALAVVPVPPAVAATPGWWPSEDAGVQAAWASGVTGKGVKVAVIDSLPVSDVPAFKNADITYHAAVTENLDGEATPCSIDGWDMPASVKSGETVHGKGGAYQVQASHGTHMLANIVGDGTWYDGQTGPRGVAPGASIDFYANGVQSAGAIMGASGCSDAGVKDAGWSEFQVGKTISKAADAGADIVSMSFLSFKVRGDDIQAVMPALRRGVLLVAGTPNDADLSGVVGDMVGGPGTLYGIPGVVGVSSVGADGTVRPGNVDGNVAVVAPGDDLIGPDRTDGREVSGVAGTSNATSVLSGYLALVVQKWPDATGNQILQSLVRNTKEGVAQGGQSGGVWLDPEHRRGFGQVDVQALLDADPTQYPDINPILEMQMTTAAADATYKGWYTQDCSTSSDGIEYQDKNGQTVEVPCESGLFLKEYERQKAAWEKVKQCEADGGSDCMRYSATATAPKSGAAAQGSGDAGNKDKGGLGSVGSGLSVPSWVWLAAGGFGLLVVAGGVTLAVVLARRNRRGARAGHGGPGALPSDPMPPSGPMGPYPPSGPPYPRPASMTQAYPQQSQYRQPPAYPSQAPIYTQRRR